MNIQSNQITFQKNLHAKLYIFCTQKVQQDKQVFKYQLSKQLLLKNLLPYFRSRLLKDINFEKSVKFQLKKGKVMQVSYAYKTKCTHKKTRISILQPTNSLALDSSDFSDQIDSNKELDLGSLENSFQKQNQRALTNIPNIERNQLDFPVKCPSKQFFNLSPIHSLNEKYFNQQINNFGKQTQRCFLKNHKIQPKIGDKTKISFRNMKNKQIIINKITQFEKYLSRLLQNLNSYKDDLLPTSPFPKKTSNKLICQIYKASKSSTKQIKQKYLSQAQIFSIKVIEVFNEFQFLRDKVQQRKFGIGDTERSNYVKILQNIFVQTQKGMQKIVKGMLFDQEK